MPTRADILNFIARERAAGVAGEIGKREIARAFGIRGSAKIDLKAILRDLQDEGALEKRGRKLARADALTDTTLAEITGRDMDGELIARPLEWDSAAHGAAPRILVQHQRRTAGPAAGVGDQVLLRIAKEKDPEPGAPSFTGRIIKLLSRRGDRVLGVFRVDSSGAGGRVQPVDKKQASLELTVSEADRGAARDGDLVSVDILRTRRIGLPAARVRDVIGAMASEKAVSQIAILTHDIPDVFRPQALEQAQKAAPARMEEEGFKREDWRAIPLLTIDPADAKDHDDAVFAEPDSDAANEGGHVVTVAIADVAFYVRPGDALDREALPRGNSVYFPDRVVPMLPERISNDLCSLREGEDRPALAVKMRLDKNGRKIGHSFHRVMMRSAAKLSYQQAQAAFDGRPDDKTKPLWDSALKPLLAAYECAKAARDKRAPLDLDLPERKIRLKPDGTVDSVETPARLEAHRLIEEFMILANVCAAETLEEKRQPLVYRAHDVPSVEKVSALSDFLRTVGMRFAKGQTLRSSHFNDILAKARGAEHEIVVNQMVLRSQAQAEYTPSNYGHFGLNLQRYAHFTSPIRRYADLIVHRALIRALHFGPGAMPEMSMSELSEIATRISAAERRAMAAERETIDRLIANFLADQIGATFAARVSGITKAGLFVRLDQTGADGFVPASTIGDEFYRYEEAQAALVGARSGRSFRLGDPVEARLVECAPLAGAMRFEIVSDGVRRAKAASTLRKTKPGKPKLPGKGGKKFAKRKPR